MNLKLIFESGDAVLISVFFVLLFMSIITWTIMIVRGIKLMQAKKANQAVKPLIWNAKTLDEAVQKAKTVPSPQWRREYLLHPT